MRKKGEVRNSDRSDCQSALCDRSSMQLFSLNQTGLFEPDRVFLYITNNGAFVLGKSTQQEIRKQRGTYQRRNDNAIMKSIRMNPTAVTA